MPVLLRDEAQAGEAGITKLPAVEGRKGVDADREEVAGVAADPLERYEATPLPRELIRPQDLIL